MKDFETIINFVDSLVHTKTGEYLNDLQRVILKECWQDHKYTYDYIASKYDYSANYIKQGVAPKLWKTISKVTGEKVSKSNFHSVLERQIILNNDINHQQLIKRSHFNQDKISALSSRSRKFVEPVQLEIPIDNVPLNSPFYIERIPHEARCYQEILCDGAFIRIKAPRQMGKSSLMYRILDRAKKQNFHTCMIHLQQAESQILDDLNSFLRWFCANLTQQLNLELNLAATWDDILGAKMSCTSYIQEYILAKLDRPLVIALEEVNEIIEYPQVAKEFLTLLRFWHERTKTNALWQKLRLVMVHSTEIYIPLNINQSPLNIGLKIELQPFSRQQVRDLVLRHHLTLNDRDLEQLAILLGGYPYLIRKALYHLSRQDIALSELLQTAATDGGIYSNHLQRHLRNLESDPELIAAFKLLLKSEQPINIEQITGFKLHSMGLIDFVGNQVAITCGLYREYFRDNLPITAIAI